MERFSRAVAFSVLMCSLWWTNNAFGSCASPQNSIEAENCLAGTPQSQWDISGAGDSTIQGFATDISFNRGQTVSFKISTTATSYKLDIYRMGYYSGMGARLITTVSPSVALPQTQPNCLKDSTTGLLDCGNWAVSATWTIPANATSGIYFAKATRLDTGGASHIVFIVRDDSSTADILFKTSDTTWQAYNDYGGGNLYTGGPGPQGGDYKVSYNRPFHTRVYEFYSWVFNAEYPMVRWLEANGFDVAYFSSLDADRLGSQILQHKVFLSVGHDEYWSGNERTNVETGRASGVHLAFFSGNEIFWKTRWEPSIDGTNTANRTLVCYKETHANKPTDPLDPPIWTGTWRDPRFSPPADGGRPENALSGTIFWVNGPQSTSQEIKVLAADGKMRFWRNTSIANLGSNQTYTTSAGLLSYEWDIDADNGFRPAGLFNLSTATYNISGNYLLDYGSTYGSGTATHHLTTYRYVNGSRSSLVFGAGTAQWAWALDGNHDGSSTTPDVNLQQATVNLFADMGVQPVNLQNGLVPASASSDTIPPVSAISSPSSGSSLKAGAAVTITGTATDTGGVVGGVEVSVDNGTTWHPATGRGTWSYAWTVPSSGNSATITSRAVDDSGNLEAAPPSVSVTITGGTVPTVVSVIPANGATGVGTATAVTVTFNEAMNASTITTSTVKLVDASNNSVSATVSYNSTTFQAVLTPTALLSNSTVYTATVVGGTGGVKDASGATMASNYTWTFTTGSTTSTNCPCSIWPSTATPASTNPNDPNAVELGVRFTSDVSGYITGIRFYKGTANTGTHIGNLWTNSGTLLASAIFSNETASGWQQVLFGTPVQIQANTVYIASYHTNVGQYAFNTGYFANSGVDNAPLHAPQNGISGLANGVYVYGNSAFPTQTYQSTNYWVDVVFTNTAPPPTAVTVTNVSPAANATNVSVSSWVSAQFNVSMSASSINSSTFQLLAASNSAVPATVSYDANSLTATLIPSSPLSYNTTYTAVIKGGASGVSSQAGGTLASDYSWTFATVASSAYLGGPGGPILVITSTSDPFSTFLAEIMRAEGLNEFAVLDLSAVSATTLSNYSVAVLGHASLTSTQASMFATWVNGGGDLIAMRPDKQLASLLGLTDAGATRANAYLRVNTTSGPGVGIVSQTIQYHGAADLYTLNGATAVATLFSNATTATTNPAVTIMNFGTNGGQAAAFTYDLARSVVYTRQGNPAWSGQARDGQSGPIRSDDLYYGAASFDPQPNWVDLSKVAIPQADEQQRLLANMILQMQSAKPLPRFWYFPSGYKAVVVMTGDDHGSFYTGSATAQRFSDFSAASPSGCSVADWQCVRATAYLFPKLLASNPLTDSQAAGYVAQGFEISVHADSSPTCSNWNASALDSFYSADISSFSSQFPSVPSPKTHRMHCVGWSDYDTQPQIEYNHGIRLDTTYYYWPPTWANNVPGMFTGSGMPMRYTDRNGNMIDVYQATSQMTDESGQTYPFTVNTLLSNATGTTAYYGAFVANIHNDQGSYPGPANQIVSAAQSYGVPVVSASQLLKWVDARNASYFNSISWTGNVLNFGITQDSNARNLQAMLPVSTGLGILSDLSRGGTSINYTTQTIKGVSYALFNAVSGTYQASYGPQATPSITSLALTASSVTAGSSTTGTVTLATAAPSGGVTVTLSSNNPSVAQVPATVTVAAGATSATFPITTTGVATSTQATISATAGVTKTATLTVNPASLTSLSLNPSKLNRGKTSTGTVTLNGAAPPAGAVITLSSSNTTIATVPSSVTIPFGATSATFTVDAINTGTATITGQYVNVTRSATLTVR